MDYNPPPKLPRQIRFYRRPAGGERVLVGTASWQDYPGGWKFFPMTVAHGASRKFWPTWVSCLPRWLGYPDRCESEVVKWREG